MAYDLEEQEKLDAIKAWWARYGVLIGGVVVLVALAAVGWKGWQWYEGHRADQAMGYFEALEEASQTDDADSVARLKAASQTLRTDYAASAYAARGALIAAQALARQQDLAGAREQLEWVARQGRESGLAPVARLRLASLLLNQKEFDAALGQLSDAPPAFAALFDDRRGDVFAAQGKTQEARQAWQRAVDGLERGDPLIEVVQLKLDALSGA